MKVIIAYGNTFMLETTMIIINSTVLLTLLLSFCRALLLILLSSGREQCYGSRRLIQGQLLLTLSYCPSQVFAEAQKDTVQAPGTIQPRSFYLRDDDIDISEGSPIGGRSSMHARKPG